MNEPRRSRALAHPWVPIFKAQKPAAQEGTMEEDLLPLTPTLWEGFPLRMPSLFILQY
jgi:hypothetical protein